MYLYIFEDGSLAQSKEMQDGDIEACDNGVLTVVDISTFPPKVYHDGTWEDVDSTDYT